jgi:hypothetical protein
VEQGQVHCCPAEYLVFAYPPVRLVSDLLFHLFLCMVEKRVQIASVNAFRLGEDVIRALVLKPCQVLYLVSLVEESGKVGLFEDSRDDFPHESDIYVLVGVFHPLTKLL